MQSRIRRTSFYQPSQVSRWRWEIVVGPSERACGVIPCQERVWSGALKAYSIQAMCYTCPRTPRHCRERTGDVESILVPMERTMAAPGSVGEFGVEFGVNGQSGTKFHVLLGDAMEFVGSSYSQGSIRPWTHSHCLPSWVLKSVKSHNPLLDNSRGEGRDRMGGSTGCLIRGICPNCTNHVEA